MPYGEVVGQAPQRPHARPRDLRPEDALHGAVANEHGDAAPRKTRGDRLEDGIDFVSPHARTNRKLARCGVTIIVANITRGSGD